MMIKKMVCFLSVLTVLLVCLPVSSADIVTINGSPHGWGEG